jgi:hypothetical protein
VTIGMGARERRLGNPRAAPDPQWMAPCFRGPKNEPPQLSGRLIPATRGRLDRCCDPDARGYFDRHDPALGSVRRPRIKSTSPDEMVEMASCTVRRKDGKTPDPTSSSMRTNQHEPAICGDFMVVLAAELAQLTAIADAHMDPPEWSRMADQQSAG